jgi:hypothetical protein
MLGPNYDPQSPRKFTRLHLLDTKGARALRAQAACNQWNYDFTNVMVQWHAEDGALQSAIPAVIEPYVGEPFLRSVRRLEVEGENGTAQQAVAIEVKTAAGRTDLCFADDRPGEVRSLREAHVSACGEFAFYSTDAAGFRQAVLVGGTLLETPLVRIAPAEPERRARVVEVDYLKRELSIDRPWPATTQPRVFEIGTPEHMTTYTAEKIQPNGPGSAITVSAGADYYRSSVEEVRPDGTVVCTLKPLIEYVSGCRKGWVASDDDIERFWRAEALGNQTFRLTPPLSPEGKSPKSEGPEAIDIASFGPKRVLRLWEYGVGDQVRQSTSVVLRRISDGSLVLETDVDVTLGLKTKGVEISRDGRNWQPLDGRQSGQWHEVRLPAADAKQLLRTVSE